MKNAAPASNWPIRNRIGVRIAVWNMMGMGNSLPETVECLECGGRVYLTDPGKNECEACLLKYDGKGRPVAR